MKASIWTRVLQIQREIWHAGDLVLPIPVPVVPAAAALAVFFLEWKLGTTFQIPVGLLPDPLPQLVPLVLPAVAWWVAGRPAIEGKPIQQYLISQLRYYLAEPRTFIQFRAAREPRVLRVSAVAFEEVPDGPR